MKIPRDTLNFFSIIWDLNVILNCLIKLSQINIKHSETADLDFAKNMSEILIATQKVRFFYLLMIGVVFYQFGRFFIFYLLKGFWLLNWWKWNSPSNKVHK